MIYLIRHTDTVADSNNVKGHREYEVSDKGKELVGDLCEKLDSIGVSPNRIVSSDLNRAVYTAEEIQSIYSSNVDIETYEELRETGFGTIHSNEELSEFNQSISDRTQEEKYRSHFPNGESTEQVCTRARSIYNNVDKSEDNIIVAHMTPIYCILSEIMDCSVYDIKSDITHCECIPISENGEILDSYVFETRD